MNFKFLSAFFPIVLVTMTASAGHWESVIPFGNTRMGPSMDRTLDRNRASDRQRPPLHRTPEDLWWERSTRVIYDAQYEVIDELQSKHGITLGYSGATGGEVDPQYLAKKYRNFIQEMQESYEHAVGEPMPKKYLPSLAKAFFQDGVFHFKMPYKAAGAALAIVAASSYASEDVGDVSALPQNNDTQTAPANLSGKSWARPAPSTGTTK